MMSVRTFGDPDASMKPVVAADVQLPAGFEVVDADAEHPAGDRCHPVDLSGEEVEAILGREGPAQDRREEERCEQPHGSLVLGRVNSNGACWR